MFRRYGTGPTVIKLMTIKPAASEDWLYITEPRDGVAVSIADLQITGLEALRFEEEHDLLRRVGGGAASVSPYDWDGMYMTIILRVHEKGLPAIQSDPSAQLSNAVFATKAGQHDPDLLLGRMQLARRTPDILHDLLGRGLCRYGFLHHHQLHLG